MAKIKRCSFFAPQCISALSQAICYDMTQIFKFFYKLQQIITKPKLWKNNSYNFTTLLWWEHHAYLFNITCHLYANTVFSRRDNKHWSPLHEGAKRTMSSASANTLTSKAATQQPTCEASSSCINSQIWGQDTSLLCPVTNEKET